jgi:1-acyl-sn-glycerol-3-phosphate acyltransferase
LWRAIRYIEVPVTRKLIYHNRFFAAVLRCCGRAFLKLSGWRIVGQPPSAPKFVAIAAPHTSNWDFPVFMAAVGYLGLEVSFLGKHTLFQRPLGWFFYWLGGIPVERDGGAAGDIVAQAVAAFPTRERLILGIAPEGTRSAVDTWKTGFYRIAEQAGVPVLPAYLDARSKTIGFGPLFTPSGDAARDIAVLRDFYKDKQGIRS